jgi:hypothetical protein
VFVNKPGDHFGEMGPLFNLPRSATARAGKKGAKLTGYTLRQYGDIVGLETLGDVLGRKGMGNGKVAAVKKATPVKKAAPAKKKAAAAKKVTARKQAAPAKKAARG